MDTYIVPLAAGSAFTFWLGVETNSIILGWGGKARTLQIETWEGLPGQLGETDYRETHPEAEHPVEIP
jgi:hypothetical protein